VRVYLDSEDGIQISISDSMKSKENSGHLLGVLIESMSDSFLSNYLKAMNIVEEDNDLEHQLNKAKQRLKSSKK